MPMVEKEGGWRDGDGPHPPQGKNGGNFRRNQNHNHGRGLGSREKTPPLAAAQPKVGGRSVQYLQKFALIGIS